MVSEPPLGPPWPIHLLRQRFAAEGDSWLDELGAFVLVGSPRLNARRQWSFATQRVGQTIPPSETAEAPLDVADSVVFPVRKVGRTFASTILVGRATSNDIAVDHNTVSKLHARLRFEDDYLLVEDAGSRNGTWVEGDRVSSACPLYAGDTVRFGSCTFEVYARARFETLLRRL